MISGGMGSGIYATFPTAMDWGLKGAIVGGVIGGMNGAMGGAILAGPSGEALGPAFVSGGAAIGALNGAAVLGGIGFVGGLIVDRGAYAFESKAPENAYDKDGPKAPGKPTEAKGFRDPKGGESWVRNPNPGRGGASHGWLDDKGRVWVPTARKIIPAHTEIPIGMYQVGRNHVNVRPGQNIDDIMGK
jgi:hypothetical protein